MIWLNLIMLLSLAFFLALMGRKRIQYTSRMDQTTGVSLLMLSLVLGLFGFFEIFQFEFKILNFIYLITFVSGWTFLIAAAGKLLKQINEKILVMASAMIFVFWLIMSDVIVTGSDAVLYLGLTTLVVTFLPKKERGR